MPIQMNNNIKSIIVFIVISLIWLPFAHAQSSCEIKADVYFINGVNKPDKKDVGKMADQLGYILNKISKTDLNIRNVTYLYNESDGFLLDIYEYAAQKAVERNAAVTDLFLSFGLTALGYVSTITDADQLAVRQRVAEVINRDLPPKTQQQISEFSERVNQSSLSAGVQAVLVPHSQGNLFANSVVDTLKLSEPAERFRGLGVVNVASPTYNAPSGLHVTLRQDFVIQDAALLALATGKLPPLAYNFDAPGANEVDPKSMTGHGFTEAYLSEKIPTGTVPANSAAAFLVGKIDTALYKTSTFYDPPSWIFDAQGNKVPKPPGYPVDSTVTQVCFPGPVGGAI